MSVNPTPSQALLLFGLLARYGEALSGDLKPAVTAGDREALVKAKLIAVEKVGRLTRFRLEDAGWAWAGAHLSAELPPAQQALQDMLARLGEHLARCRLTLADVIGTPPKTAAPDPAPPPRKTAKRPAAPRGTAARGKAKAPTPAALRKRIEAAYLVITGGRRNESVRLARLRAELADLDRATLDAGLGRILQGDRKASLMRHDDPRQIEAADREAAYSPAGEPFHLLWIAS